MIYYLSSGPEKDSTGSFTAACRTLNASVRAYDTLINPQKHDMVQPHVWEQIKFLLKDEADGALISPCCGSFSRARNSKDGDPLHLGRTRTGEIL